MKRNFQLAGQLASKITVVLACMTIGTAIQAQEETLNKSIRIGYQHCWQQQPDGYFSNSSVSSSFQDGNGITIDATLWKIAQRLSFGVHMGLYNASIGTDNQFQYSKTIGVGYGVQLSYNILTYTNKLEVNMNALLGSYFQSKINPTLDYGLSATFTYYPLTHVGVFVEPAWGKFHFGASQLGLTGFGHTSVKAGISYRF